MAETTTEQQKPDARPASPTTPAELQRSLSLIRRAIAFGIVAIVVMTIVFVGPVGAPAVPLVPLAALVVVTDLIMLVVFTRQRRRAIDAALRRESGLPG